jgi:hypothetical protein
MDMRIYPSRTTYPHGPFKTGVFTWLELPVAVIAVVIAGGAIGCILLLVPVLGQLMALGWREAWDIYHLLWTRFVELIASAMVGAFLLVVVFDRFYIAALYAPHRSSVFFPRLKGFVIGLVGVAVVGAIGVVSFRQARHTRTHIAASRGSFPPSELTPRLTTDAWRIVHQLDMQAAESKLAASQLEHAIVAAQQANGNGLQHNPPGSHSLLRQIARMQALIDSTRVVTRADLDQAQKSGLWQGVLLGVVTSVLGSFVFSALTALRGGRA